MAEYGARFSQAVSGELRAERVRQKKTVASIVEDTALSKSAVLHYLNGHRDIPTTALIDLCRSLGVTPQEIFERAERFVE